MDTLKNNLNLYFGQKAPALPEAARSFIVAVAPWLVIFSVIIALPDLLAVLGMGSIFAPSGYSIHYSGILLISVAISLFGAFFNLMAISGLFKRSLAGWNFVFYSSLFYVLSSLVAGSIVGALLGFLIDMYLLFQVRSYYH